MPDEPVDPARWQLRPALLLANRACDAAAPDDSGETAATELPELFRRHHAELLRLAVLIVRDQPIAEDVVQDVFTRLHARGHRAGDLDQALVYLRAAVLNGCRSVLRRQAVGRRLGGMRDWPYSRSPSGSAEQEAIRAEDRDEVLRALAALPARRREVLVLRYYLSLSEAEIAATLGISAGTVKSTAARGIAALARALKEES
ncbi:MAG TPA: SigE family RNA polymerase sigma factor [Streptosporangiaceae bacterium]|nr:SigE family RNA polymerase sigma factor [Streptosporangiaceae bacterium]